MGYGKAILEREGDPFAAFYAITGVIAGCEEYALTEGERHLRRVENLISQVRNGGFDQYFFNSGVWEASEAIQALRAISCPKILALLEKAVATVNLPRPVPDDYSYEATEDQEKALDVLDREFYGVADEPYGQAVAYVASHPEEFQGAA